MSNDDWVHVPARARPRREGGWRDAFWHYLLGTVLIIGGGLILNMGLLALFKATGHADVVVLLGHEGTGTIAVGDRLLAFAYLMLSLIVFLPLMRIVLPALHQRPWASFVSAGRWRWGRLARSLIVMAGLLLATIAIQLVFAPRSLHYEGHWHEIGLFALAALVLAPLQVFTEEVFFRGYLMQAIARATPLALLQIVIPAVLFTGAHAQNPEALQGAAWAVASYASAGFYLGLLTLYDRGIESAVGAHLAINLFAILVVGSSASVSPSSVIWRDAAPDYRLGFLSGLVVFALHFAILVWARRRKDVGESQR